MAPASRSNPDSNSNPLEPPLRLVATCAAGLEEILAAELEGMGLRPGAREPGGVSFTGDFRDLARSNLLLRTANRVLVEIDRFAAPDGDAIARRGEALAMGALGDWLPPERSFAIAATSTASAVRDTRWAAMRLKDGLVDGQRRRFGGRRSDVARDRPDLLVRLRLHRDSGTVLLDSTGEPLDRRGYRERSVGAPVRETLAAACVLASGWDGRGPVVDPMCGTGTLLAEAASFALGRPPSILRDTASFAFSRFPPPAFEPRAFGALRRAIDAPSLAEADAAAGPRRRLVPLYGCDLSRPAVDAARINLKRALLDGALHLRLGRAEDFEPPVEHGPGLVVVNPPYGERLATDRDRWRAVGDLLKQRYRGWRAVVLAGGEGMGKHIGLRPRRRIPVRNGPLEARILVFELY